MFKFVDEFGYMVLFEKDHEPELVHSATPPLATIVIQPSVDKSILSVN
jgi:hypothetical protein